MQACSKLVDDVLKQMGRANILVSNAAYQMEVESITDLSEEQWGYTFKTRSSGLASTM